MEIKKKNTHTHVSRCMFKSSFIPSWWICEAVIQQTSSTETCNSSIHVQVYTLLQLSLFGCVNGGLLEGVRGIGDSGCVKCMPEVSLAT